MIFSFYVQLEREKKHFGLELILDSNTFIFLQKLSL